MIRDEDLKSSVDYSEGQKRAAHRVLVELVNIFEEYEDEIRVVGGWVPDLMFPQEGHVASLRNFMIVYRIKKTRVREIISEKKNFNFLL